MRVFVAGFCHESMSKSPIPTTRQSFESFDYHRPEGGVPDADSRSLNGYGVFITLAEADGHDVYASSYSFAQPSAPMTRADYEDMRDEILDDLAKHGPFDMAFFFLHGAQLVEDLDDPEGDILDRARTIVGPDVFIGAELDLHANVTDTMVDATSVLLACKHYPHIDFNERAADLYRLGVAAAKGEVRPINRFERIPMIGMHYTTLPAMEAANAAAQAVEDRDDVLSVSLIHGFPWADLPAPTAGVLVVTDGDSKRVDDDIRLLSKKFFDAREETRSQRMSISATLDRVEAAAGGDGKPFVIADACDNPGGGTGCDSTFILEQILERGLTGYVAGLIWDPIAVRFAGDVGVGGSFALRLGGKTGPQAGRPLDVYAKVIAYRDNMSQKGLGYTHPIGSAVALEFNGNIAVACTVRGQVFSPSCFTDLGIRLEDHRAFVVKSSQHFYAQFEPHAREIIYCDTPGGLSLDIRAENYTDLQRPVWPLDDVVV